MFLGHHGVALAAKRVAPAASLGTLVLASIWLDVVWPVMLLVGVESVEITGSGEPFRTLAFEHYPWSHSMVLALGWGVLFGLVHWLVRRDRRTAVVLGSLVASHWVLDLIVHFVDLPLWPGGPEAGLALWQNVSATLALELALLVGGLTVYLRVTKPRRRLGWGILVAYVLLMLASYAGSVWGPPPESVPALAVGALGQLLLVALAAWADHRREPSVAALR